MFSAKQDIGRFISSPVLSAPGTVKALSEIFRTTRFLGVGQGSEP